MFFDDDIDTHHEAETDRERVVGFLRKEAFDVRDCFTRYSVYMFMASAALVVAIARITLEDPEKYLYVGLFGFFPALFLFLILGMGAHKFGTSNRILGYELHLQRTGHYLERDLCHQLMKTVEWEEAMRAWRFVVPTLWAKIYWPSDSFGKRFFWLSIRREIINTIEEKIRAAKENKENNKNDKRPSLWFDRYKSLEFLYGRHYKGIEYNAGGYLKTVIFIFSVSILLCLTMPTFVAVQSYYDLAPVLTAPDRYARIAHDLGAVLDLIVLVSYIIAVIVMFGAWLNIYCRIQILESGLLSIHSCGIIWEATVLAHLLVLVELDFFNDDVKERSMHGYTPYISEKAVEISLHAADIHDWMKKTRESLNSSPKIRLPPVRPCRHMRPTVLAIAPSLRGRRVAIRASNAIPW